MGNCTSDDLNEQVEANDRIEKEIRRDKRKNEQKLLLLGA